MCKTQTLGPHFVHSVMSRHRVKLCSENKQANGPFGAVLPHKRTVLKLKQRHKTK